VSRFHVGRDQKTAYERQTGRQCKHEVLPFGGIFWFRRLTDHSDKKASMDNKWPEVVWLGHNRESNESLIATPKGVMKALAMRRRVPDERWNKESISNMKGHPARHTVRSLRLERRFPQVS